MEYKHIIVGVDFSPCSAEALKDAVRLGAATEAQISVVHILDREVMDYLNGHTVLDEEVTRKEAQVRLDDFASLHVGDYQNVETSLIVGHPFADLVKSCSAKKADLLLLGSRGHGNDDGHLGVIASKCLRKAPLPVMLSQDRRGEPIRQVVCCVADCLVCGGLSGVWLVVWCVADCLVCGRLIGVWLVVWCVAD